ncbi:MAG TPA: adenylate/guanylate cyclase domain-containing protein [Nitrososphaerales archaeon]|nr:adenylate/guanylate cyclase domain-containing protein [Nitrososphaerales archaeon]
MSQGRRRLAAIMFTDMVGYTALGQRNELLSLALVEEHRKLIRAILTRHNGKEIQTIGDAFLVEFESGLDSVRCAYDIQRAIREFNFSLPEDRRVHLRIGIHLGDVIESKDTISGDAVNVASRIEPLAQDGGVCLTRQVYDQIQNKFDLSLESLGPKQLKNVDLAVEVFKIVMPWMEIKATGTAELDRKRIVVLPFANMSPDPADGYFADGMTEELITSLSAIRELSVIARTSVMKYKASSKGAAEIGNDLRAGTLIEGSVRKSGERVRITVQFIDARNEDHVWAQSYDKQLDDIFAIQSDIAGRVSNELKIKLLESEKKELERKPTNSTEAYTFYLKGRYYWNERSDEGMRKAIEYLKHAIRVDPDFALGYSGLADCYMVMAHNGQAEPEPTYLMAKEYAQKAQELDQGLAEAHTAMAAVLSFYEHLWEPAEVEFKRAIDLQPSYSSAHQWYHNTLLFLRRFGEAKAEITKALQVDPFSYVINLVYGWSLYYRKEFDRAIEHYKKVLEMEPTFQKITKWYLITPYVHKGMFDEALALSEEVVRIPGESPFAKTLRRVIPLTRGYVYAAMGKPTEARRLLDKAAENYHLEHQSPYMFARAYLLLGDNDEAIRWLQIGYDEFDGLLFFPADFELAGVKDDPRYATMKKRMGLDRIPP